MRPVPVLAKSYGLSTAMHFIFLANHDTMGVLIAFIATKKLISFKQNAKIIYNIYASECIVTIGSMY
jgi:hypothetical protein